MKIRAYISGPMSSVKNDNEPEFTRAAKLLRSAGYEVVNPIELDQRGKHPSMKWEDFIRRDIPEVLKCQVVFLLPGWENSRGATLEALIAYWVKIPVYYLDSVIPVHPGALWGAVLRLLAPY